MTALSSPVDSSVEPVANPARSNRDPSSIRKRAWVAFAALIGAGIATRLVVYQIGYAPPPYDPFFAGGTVRVLTSPLATSLPIPDAAFGVAAYLAEVLLLVVGGAHRWRTHPRVVYVYAALAFAMALGSIGLIVAQAAVVHAFCTLCLVSAFLSFVLVVPAAIELRAAWNAWNTKGNVRS